MDRLGRGYSFEALRAKVLFAEGTHKKSQKRPAFERRAPPSIPSLGRHMVGFKSLVSTNYYQNQAEDESEEPKNYGTVRPLADSWLLGFQTIYCAMQEVSIYSFSTNSTSRTTLPGSTISTLQQKS